MARPAAFAAIVPLLLGSAAVVDSGRLLVWDAWLTDMAVGHRSGGIDAVALAVSKRGAWAVVYPVGAVLAAVAARRSRPLALAIVVTVVSRPAIEWLLKDLVARPRPAGARLVAGTGFSYPSGHVLAAAATWAFLPPIVALYTRRRDIWVASVVVASGLIVAVAWSRVWLGVHWTSDVVASLLLSFVALSGIEVWLQRRTRAGVVGARAGKRRPRRWIPTTRRGVRSVSLVRVLVVEDEAGLAAGLQAGLEGEGFAVDVAADGPEGLWLPRPPATPGR